MGHGYGIVNLLNLPAMIRAAATGDPDEIRRTFSQSQAVSAAQANVERANRINEKLRDRVATLENQKAAAVTAAQ